MRCQTFQQMMDQIPAGLEYTFVYLDDKLVASKSHQEHAVHLQAVLGQLKKHGLVLNTKKCLLGVAELDYLCHHVSASGIQPLREWVRAV